jgi:demethylmenaquinone methyltransferase / 2-methoxy-6-polyprenyl-1,4-benzoquinol methylase
MRVVDSMFDRIAPRYDLVNRIMTFGMDLAWRRRTVDALYLDRGSLVLDLACGTGDLCCELRKKGYKPVGFDLSQGMLHAARPCGPYARADILRLPVANGHVDGITCGFALRNVTSIETLFSECARVIRTGGRLAVLEMSAPNARLPRAVHRVYMQRVVPLIGAALSDRDAYRYLPRSAAYLPSSDELMQMLERNGLTPCGAEKIGFGAAQIIVAAKR